MSNPPAVRPAGFGVLAVVAIAVLVAGLAVWLVDRTGSEGNGLSDAFDYQIDQYKKIDPSLISHRETARFASGLASPAAVAVGSGGKILAAGDQEVRVFDFSGNSVSSISLEGHPTCLAVAPEDHPKAGTVFVGVGDHLELFAPDGKRAGIWDSLGEKAVLTSIAVSEADVFVADAGQSRIHRLGLDGEAIGAIGDRSGEEGQAAFAVPSPYFDVAMHPDGWLRVVNPGALRVEAFSFDGRLELFWGKSGATIDGFFGCCNPANLAVLPDGRFVTAEKGLVRVKIHGADGHFESVVAGPESFGAEAAAANASLSDHEDTAVDVAVGPGGEIVVLDLTTGEIHTFEEKSTDAASRGEGEDEDA